MPGRARAGCLGCLGRFLGILLLAFVGGTVLIVAIAWMFTPWAFYLGGSFHAMPLWQGAARVHGPAGDYTLYLWMSPARRGGRYNFPGFDGWGSLCTPRGERYPMRLRAYMSERPGTDTNGKEMRIELSHRPWYWTLTGSGDFRPRLTLRGRWQNPDFVANDGGTLSIAFLPDGRVYDGPARNQPRARDTVPVIFHEVPWTTWFSDCRAVK